MHVSCGLPSASAPPPCRRSPGVCTTYRLLEVQHSRHPQPPPSLGRRAWRAVCGSRLRSLEPCAREPASPTYIDAIQARQHPSLAHEACLVWRVSLPYDMPHMISARGRDAHANARRCRPTDREPGLLHFSVQKKKKRTLHLAPCTLLHLSSSAPACTLAVCLCL